MQQGHARARIFLMIYTLLRGQSRLKFQKNKTFKSFIITDQIQKL